LPALIKKASNLELKSAFKYRLVETRNHIRRSNCTALGVTEPTRTFQHYKIVHCLLLVTAARRGEAPEDAAYPAGRVAAASTKAAATGTALKVFCHWIETFCVKRSCVSQHSPETALRIYALILGIGAVAFFAASFHRLPRHNLCKLDKIGTLWKEGLTLHPSVKN
jgi:hypothetical protein